MMQKSDSAEAVAYALFECVCYVEGKDIGTMADPPKEWERPTRSWIFSAYAECLNAVRSGNSSARLDDLEARSTYTGARRVPRAAILASDPV